MYDIAEKFVPEYSNVLNAIIGATFIKHIGNLQEAFKCAEFLLQHDVENRFPIFSEMKIFYSEIWYSKPYSQVLRLHFTVDFIEGTDVLYYKAFIQTLEIRKIKFRTSHTSRTQRFFKDLNAYVTLANELFEHNQRVSKKQLTPYEYILHHQSFRKVYQLGMKLEEAMKKMPADKTPETKGEVMDD